MEWNCQMQTANPHHHLMAEYQVILLWNGD